MPTEIFRFRHTPRSMILNALIYKICLHLKFTTIYTRQA